MTNLSNPVPDDDSAYVTEAFTHFLERRAAVRKSFVAQIAYHNCHVSKSIGIKYYANERKPLNLVSSERSLLFWIDDHRFRSSARPLSVRRARPARPVTPNRSWERRRLVATTILTLSWITMRA